MASLSGRDKWPLRLVASLSGESRWLVAAGGEWPGRLGLEVVSSASDKWQVASDGGRPGASGERRA